MSDFLLELCSEEIPARMQPRAKEDLARLFTEEMARAGITVDHVETFATPRRLALIARGLPRETDAVTEERKGPRANAPEQAIAGFLRSTGLTRDALVERDGTLFAVIDKPGRPTAEVLAEVVPAIIRAFPWPKSMRWGAASASTESLRWVRPLHHIVALLDADVVPLSVDGIASGRETAGHRFHHRGPVTIASTATYVDDLRAAHVIVHLSERSAIIRDGANRLAAAAGLSIVADEGLVLENAGLTEWPVPLMGAFDPAFLAVPPEVIQLSARLNQKYFVLTDASGSLARNFICTANIEATDGGAAIIAGNEKVLAARLSDAKFFWEGDLKVPLAMQAEKLGHIVFHEKLGTVADKVDRVAKLARWVAAEGIITADPALAERAARLAKADLVTGMVGEFPELQGVIGGYLARAQDEDAAVADAIRDHYKPVGQGDEVPTAPVTIAVSLADKLDSLGGFFSNGMAPTGSKDPFALRRAAIGLLSLIITNRLRVGYRRLLEQSVDAEHAAALEAFLIERLKVQQRDAGVRHDLIDAVFALGEEDDLVRLLGRVAALQSFMATQDGANLLAAYKRAANILKQAGDEAGATGGIDRTALHAADVALEGAIEQAAPTVASAIAAEDFSGAMGALASLRAPIDSFFADVLVNDLDPAVRAWRLGLLARFREAVHRVADFSRIEG